MPKPSLSLVPALLLALTLSAPVGASAMTRDATHWGDRAVHARQEALDLLRPLVSACPSEVAPRDTCVELNLRFGALLIDEGAWQWERELSRWQDLHDRWEDFGSLGEEPRPTHVASSALRRRAVQILRDALILDPDHARVPETRFHIGQTLLLLDHPDAALSWLRLLVDQHPNSPLTPDALLTIGEVWLDRDAPHKALPALARAAAIDSPLRSWALTRLAWARSAVGDAPGAVSAIVEALRTDPDASFAPEARAALTRYLSNTDDVGAARALLDELAPADESGALLSALADLWSDQGRDQLTLSLLGGLLSGRRSDGAALEWQVRLVRLHTRSDRFEAADRAAADLLAEFGPGSSWLRERDAAQQDDDVALCERTQRELAIALHRAALELAP